MLANLSLLILVLGSYLNRQNLYGVSNPIPLSGHFQVVVYWATHFHCSALAKIRKAERRWLRRTRLERSNC